MSLKEELKKSLVGAAKAKDQVLLDTLRSVQSAIRYKEIDKRAELTEPEVQGVIAGLCKKHRESIDQFRKGGREDLVQKESRELAILEKYLPQMLTEQEVEALVRKAIADCVAQGPQDMGRVMKALMPQVSGRADGKLVSQIVTSLLKK